MNGLNIIQESALEKYRSGEFHRSLSRVLTGIPIAFAVNSALLIGLVSLGRNLDFTSPADIPIEIVVTDVVEPPVEPEVPIVEPPPESVPLPEPAPIVAETPTLQPEPKVSEIKSEAKTSLPSENQTETKTVTQTETQNLATPSPTPFSNLLKEVLPGATESRDGDTETPASEDSGSSFEPGSGTNSEGSGTSEFADRIRGLLKGTGTATSPSAALPEPPPQTVPQTSTKFGCVQCEKPAFPERAKERGIQGEAKVSVDVDANGNVTAVHLVNSSGHPELDQVAIEQAKKWRFTPSEGGKKGVGARVDFQIEGTDYQRESQARKRQREEQRRQAEPPPIQERPVTTTRPAPPEPVVAPSPQPVAPVYSPPPEPVATPPEPPLPAYEPPPPVYEAPPVNEPPPPIEEGGQIMKE